MPAEVKVSVTASFIDGLLSTSGDSNAGGSGDAVQEADTGAGDGAAKPEPVSGIGNPPDAGDQPAQKSVSLPEAGKGAEAKPGDQPAVAEAAKAPDPPAAQIANLNGALREVRGENKELKQQLSKYSEQLTALQKQIEALGKPAATATEPEADPEPDFLNDPKVYVDKKLTKAEEAVKKLEESAKQRDESAKQQQELQQQWGEVLEKETAFAAETPDYQEAIQYVRNIRAQAFIAEFEAMNDRQPNQREVTEALTRQEIQGALTLQKKGKNPAQWYYGYAKSIGYKTPEPVPTPTPADAAIETPKPVAKPAPAKPDKDAVRTMGSGGGEAARGEEDPSRDPMAGVLGAVHAEMTAKRKARRG